MQQFFNDFKNYIQDRFGNPFWLSTLFAWCLINWPLLVTALFQTELFNVRYILNYTSSNTSARYIWWPLFFGLGYSIFSGVLKETLEGIAKSFRAYIAQKFMDLGFYPSISLEDHKKEIAILESRLIRNEFKQQDLSNANAEIETLNSDLQSKREQIIKIESILIKWITRERYLGFQEKSDLLNELHNIEICSELDSRDIIEPNVEKNFEKDIPEGIKGSTFKTSRNLRKREIRDNYENIALFETLEDSESQNILADAIRKHEAEHVKDPRSLKSLLLTLLLYRSPDLYTHAPKPEQIGLDSKVFNLCANSALKANLLSRLGSQGNALTSSGNDFIQKELGKDENHKIALILKETERLARSKILSTLETKHLSKQEIARTVQYHPEMSRILNQMIEEKQIADKGGVIFPNES
ncbi:hypothetical protein [Marinobacter nauticus]|uniref:hypothetical protein n=1 Tax=Marinobacter nauticus TaxID=2743 RepID=UPI001CFE4578|nr:hypothetical protein [Marinobacter nauticus]